MASNPVRTLLARPERREALLRAAAATFAHEGYAATSVDEVAAAAGITRLIVYRHFESKEALYTAVLQRVRDRLGEEFAAAAAAGLDDRRALSAIRAILVVGREDPDGLRLLWRHAATEPKFAAYAEDFREKAIAFARSLLQAAAVSGRLRERWAAETLVSYVFDAVLHWLDEGSPGRDDEFLALMGASLPALVTAWSGVGEGATNRRSLG